jgi:hypothetical protein
MLQNVTNCDSYSSDLRIAACDEPDGIEFLVFSPQPGRAAGAVTTGLWLDDRGTIFVFATTFGAYPAFYPMGTGFFTRA